MEHADADADGHTAVLEQQLLQVDPGEEQRGGEDEAEEEYVTGEG
jgi:hypothetical protein